MERLFCKPQTGIGRLIALAADGSEVAEVEFGHASSLTCSPDGVCAAALEDGRLLLLGPTLEVLHDSPAADDDVEPSPTFGASGCFAFPPLPGLFAFRPLPPPAPI